MLTVTTATQTDTPTITEILEELDRFYGVTEFAPAHQRASQISSLLFRDPPAANVLLAWADDTAAGLASYSFLWPAAGITSSLFLKELYVVERYRKRGVGRALMARLSEIASENSCSRVEWTTERDNADARRFYEAIGVPLAEDKVFYRADGEAIARLRESAT